MVRSLTPPERGNRITYDKGKDAITRFRAPGHGSRREVLHPQLHHRRPRAPYHDRFLPGVVGQAAREEAKQLRQRATAETIRSVSARPTRDAATVGELCDRYLAEHADPETHRWKQDEAQIRRVVRPELGNRKVAAITYSDIDRLHRKVTKESGPYAGNRLMALLSKMFSLAIRWEMRTDNPAKGVERNPEERRYRYLDRGRAAPSDRSAGRSFQTGRRLTPCGSCC